MNLGLAVVRGPDAGARLLVGTTPQRVGRGRDVELALTDRSVSRQHIEVVLVGARVKVTLCEGAAPFVVGDEDLEVAELAVGGRVILGDTILEVFAAKAGSNADVEVTDVSSLLGGLAGDVRVLAALYALTEALDAAADAPAVDAALADWARRHVRATSARITEDSGAPSGLGVRREGDGTAVTIAAGADAPFALALTFEGAPDSLGESMRRMLVVAGHVAASSFARLRALDTLAYENATLRSQVVGSARRFLGSSKAAEEVAALIPRLAASDSVVLLRGETGVGKTFVARLIHEAGKRAREPLRVLNCAAIPETLVESELFGHERGAFTGAVAARAGAFEAAGAGTLLLDEIGELPLPSQAKLLRVLEDKQFERIGGNRPVALRARVLAATNRDLAAMVKDGSFRRDLFFRIHVVTLDVAPLRERVADLPMLAAQILRDLAASAGRRVGGFSPEALLAIQRYAWPGNVRELRNAIEHAVVLGSGPTIEAADLPRMVRDLTAPPEDDGDPSVVRLPAKLEWLEERAIDAAMKSTGGNVTHAAAILGLNRATLYKKMKKG